MSVLHIDIVGGENAFEPGDEITGTVSWKMAQPPRSLELRLFWLTRGRGSEDVGMIETRRFENAGREESRAFTLPLPAGPYSFSGKLISLSWALEFVEPSSKSVRRAEIVVAPGKHVIHLPTVGK